MEIIQKTPIEMMLQIHQRISLSGFMFLKGKKILYKCVRHDSKGLCKYRCEQCLQIKPTGIKT